jgi:hypothetical protein
MMLLTASPMRNHVSVLEANSILFTDIDNVEAYVDDATVFFNFQKGKGAFEPDGYTNSWLMPATTGCSSRTRSRSAKSTSPRSTRLPTPPWAVSGQRCGRPRCAVTPDDYADYAILSFVNKYVPIQKIGNYPVDKMGAVNDEFVYISMDDLSFLSQVKVEPIDANGFQTFLWKVPCTPAYLNKNFAKAEAGTSTSSTISSSSSALLWLPMATALCSMPGTSPTSTSTSSRLLICPMTCSSTPP